ncbi:hypothetical protein JTE90_002268 [Oedothorax gibbosus]|uniref:Uncharacterized protein n=1 Tax=Oedothorax gibbosus TaxID=931172 RepID=A0AAV6TQU8_9ARAC|nr:hypothetical protein JTE90_002268 [Oedothorax gibbosus]
MPNYCVPLRELKALFNSDLTPQGKLITEKLTSLECFFDDHDKCQLSMGMRNVLVGEFIAPILDQFKPLGRSGSMGKVDNMVEVRKKEIEIGKLRASLSAIQSKVTVLEEELAKEREAIRKYLENGVALSKTVEEIEKVSDNKVANIKKTYESQLTALDLLEKERNNRCNKFLEKLVKGRADEISTTDKILAHYDANFREQNEKIAGMSSEMGEIKEAIKNSLDNLKSELTNHSMPATSASPTYADIIGKENNNSTTMFVDLPTDGEGGIDFKGFKNKLESLLTNENVKCNGIFETKKGVKISAPSLTDAQKIQPDFPDIKNFDSKIIVSSIPFNERFLILNPVESSGDPDNDVNIDFNIYTDGSKIDNKATILPSSSPLFGYNSSSEVPRQAVAPPQPAQTSLLLILHLRALRMHELSLFTNNLREPCVFNHAYLLEADSLITVILDSIFQCFPEWVFTNSVIDHPITLGLHLDYLVCDYTVPGAKSSVLVRRIFAPPILKLYAECSKMSSNLNEFRRNSEHSNSSIILDQEVQDTKRELELARTQIAKLEEKVEQMTKTIQDHLKNFVKLQEANDTLETSFTSRKSELQEATKEAANTIQTVFNKKCQLLDQLKEERIIQARKDELHRTTCLTQMKETLDTLSKKNFKSESEKH